MNSWKILDIYFSIYKILIDNVRATAKQMANELGYRGRGRSPSTIYKHYQNMLAKQITKDPILILKPFKIFQSTAYFCRKNDRNNLSRIFSYMQEEKSIDYILFLAGAYDFFLTSRIKPVIEKYDLTIVDELKLYSPVFTIPKEWNININDAFNQLLKFDYVKGNIERTLGSSLIWDEIDWKIYDAIKYNCRKGFSRVAKGIGIWPKTVQKHFNTIILPNCTVGHYFFPKGYDFYDKMFLRIQTQYEKSLLDALSHYPCTCYVYPFERDMAVVIFHNSTYKLMITIQKLEEIGIIDSYSLSVPLIHL